MEIKKEIAEKIHRLGEKYNLMGQSLDSYLEGLLLSNYLTYWDYIQLDTLLTLQNPKTDFPDEKIFIMYHQITELYFKLSLHELEQIAHNGRHMSPTGQNLGWKSTLEADYFTRRITRINRYFEALTKSFEIMVDGMEKEQFLQYRMALLPASGFQSVQYRKIEMCATDLLNLVDKDVRPSFKSKPTEIEELFSHIYWNKGATDLVTGEKTLTLRQFEKKYTNDLITVAKDYQYKNMWAKYKALPQADQQNTTLLNALKEFDVNVNINWPLVHYKSAVRYLQQNHEDIPATGGTNWQKYLPPRFQKRMFYPELWTEQEQNDWGKAWVETNVFRKG